MIPKTRSHLVLLLAAALLVSTCGLAWATADAGADAASYRIGGIQLAQEPDGFLITVQGGSAPTYTMYELFEPLRIVLDIADATIAKSVHLPMKPAAGPVVEVRAARLGDQKPAVTRLEMLLKSDSQYAVERQGNDIVVRFSAVAAATADEPGDAGLVASLIEQDTEGGDEAADSEEASAKTVPAAQGREELAFAGYTKERITVDFFKIDLHNVFRLIGEVSGLNIVVDEAVKGSLTLALNDVPWDFALDVILNLKDLQKMERFNTIMILPKDRKIDWPERAVDRLAFKAGESDVAVEEKAAISVKERLAIPKEEVEARNLVRQANAKIRAKDNPGALAMYEQAFGLWRENGQLASQIASLCLVPLGMNEKAVYYAKQALRINPQDTGAALQAAIGLANMQKKDEALVFFKQAIQGARPQAAALQGYAAFLEQQGDNAGALALLNTCSGLHADTVDSMVNKARLFDKLGQGDKAVEQYRAILFSGFDVPPDLKRYITARVAR
ncbi:MAG: energy transducer TonB [Deltaproteobacteria bacterium CG_4_10_14_3_um_filter_60_8]|nr:MAG: hypothetical protein AUK28_03275 [Desulfobacterales bacterium CG2_30_60_27]PIY25029.1 MAG: energy transducer TonB [Deltaproteobacteria bacterium CG_4_10_14_3_um_filter_60_8]